MYEEKGIKQKEYNVNVFLLMHSSNLEIFETHRLVADPPCKTIKTDWSGNDLMAIDRIPLSVTFN